MNSPNFKPTYLYIKKHRETGLKYFGRTIRPDPQLYPGSGTEWNQHCNRHGWFVDTIWFKLFTDEQELRDFAYDFSTENNIVESKEWANMIPEDGGSYHDPNGKYKMDPALKKLLTEICKPIVPKPKPVPRTTHYKKPDMDYFWSKWSKKV